MFLPGSPQSFLSVLQSDVREVRGAASAATPPLQEHPAGAPLHPTLEVSGWRHPGAAHRSERCKMRFPRSVRADVSNGAQNGSFWCPDSVFRHLPGLHLHPGLLPVPGVQQTEPRGETSDSAGTSSIHPCREDAWRRTDGEFCPSDGGGGAKAAVAAAGAGHSNTQLPESHPGESASSVRSFTPAILHLRRTETNSFTSED